MANVKIAINGFGRIGRMTFKNLVKTKDLSIFGINDSTGNYALVHLLKYSNVSKEHWSNSHVRAYNSMNQSIFSPSQTTNMKAVISMSNKNLIFNLEYQKQSNGCSDFEILIKTKDWRGDGEELLMFLQNKFLNQRPLLLQTKPTKSWAECLDGAIAAISRDNTSESFNFLQKILDSWEEKESKKDFLKGLTLLQSRFAHIEKEKCSLANVDYNSEIHKIQSALISYIQELQKQI